MNCKMIGLVGNPNCGKSTLFNALTGARQKVANWPGVTVECKQGQVTVRSQQYTLVDLPGIYQLASSSQDQAVDEQISCDYILQKNADLIINVIDAAHLERHLYLTLQLLTMNVPTILAVNMLDVANRRQIKIDLNKLQEKLGCPVIGLVANKGTGIEQLKNAIASFPTKNCTTSTIPFPDCANKALADLIALMSEAVPEFSGNAQWLAQQLLFNPDFPENKMPQTVQALAAELRNKVSKELQDDLDIVFADVLYSHANELVLATSTTANTKTPLTEKIDKIVLNRFLGIPIFLAVMYCMFLFSINLGGAFQDFFDIGSNAIFVQGTTEFLTFCHAPTWVIALLAVGFGKGVNTTISFIPVIASMFFALAFLESTGYMTRATFVIDRFMRTVGLPGKSFVPMIVGFGCNVPAILAARTLDNSRDRTLTILMSPFMSCGARLAIFAVFTAAFFPQGGQNVVFMLYFIGIAVAIFTGFILRKTLLQGELTPLLLELPAYHVPTLKSLLLQTWHRLKSFVWRAGKLIVPICMLIGMLNAINLDGTLNQAQSNRSSLLCAVGRTVTPLLSPMGINDNNWPATVGLVTGILAKEVVIGSLNTLYLQDAHLGEESESQLPLLAGLKSAVLSVPTNLMALKKSLTNPLVASTPENTVNHSVYGIMYERFGGKAAAFAYLLFVLLYFPCVSATAVMAKELNKKWAAFSIAWSTGIAYAVATSFYQLATFTTHPKQSFLWVGVIVMTFGTILSLMKKYGQSEDDSPTNPPACTHHLGCKI